MVRLGGLLTFFGLGSVVLYSFDMQFKVLEWAEPMQPWLGMVLLLAGLAVLAVKFLVNNNDTPVQEGVPAAPQIGPPPGGYAPPPTVQRGQNPAQYKGFPQAGGFTPTGRQPGAMAGSPAGRFAGSPGNVQPGAPVGAYPGPFAGPQGYGQPQGPEPVLGRPQFAPQVNAAPPGQQRQVPPAAVPQFPPRQQPPQDQSGPQA